MKVRFVYPIIMLILLSIIYGCSPEVGSKAWCEKMGDTPEAEWTPKDGSAFMKNCNLSDLYGK